MRTKLFFLAWAFILAVAAWDAWFAWQYRAVFAEWEVNPLACWVVDHFGLAAIFTMKAAVVTFATVVAALCHHLHSRLTVPYTALIGVVHLLLSLRYLAGYLGQN